MDPLTIGFSPCPNDTFIFNHLVHGNAPGPVFGKPFLEDVETLNQWAFERRLDVTKLSYHALGHLTDEYCVLRSGSALGRGCGPLLVAGSDLSPEELKNGKIAIPGKYTTAAMLFRMFCSDAAHLVETRFDRIMDKIRSGEVTAGVIIHESRFTYRQQGLVCIQDLGKWWEESTGLPIPLGCIAARKSLGNELIAQIDAAIRTSIGWAYENRSACAPFIRSNAQELDEAVIRSHIDLYVNDFSLDLGEEGMRAVMTFIEKGRAAGILPDHGPGIFCHV